MPFESEIYEEIIKDYEAKRLMHKHERNARLEEIYAKDAELEQIDMQMQTIGSQTMMQILEAPAMAKTLSAKMQAEIARLQAERNQRLAALGLPEDYTNLHFDCTVCDDTGYVNGRLCDCVRRRATHEMRFASEIAPMLNLCNFEKYNFELCKGDDYKLMRENYNLAQSFIDNFDNSVNNLLFYGRPGCGKTFLSACIAGALLEKQVNVVYKSATRLFTEYLDYMFNRADAISAKREMDRVLNAQLLIIDDLGTEAINTHTTSFLFTIINERAIHKRSTIISTNFSLEEISDKYSDRISSRLFESYDVVSFPESDLRMKVRHG